MFITDSLAQQKYIFCEEILKQVNLASKKDQLSVKLVIIFYNLEEVLFSRQVDSKDGEK